MGVRTRVILENCTAEVASQEHLASEEGPDKIWLLKSFCPQLLCCRLAPASCSSVSSQQHCRLWPSRELSLSSVKARSLPRGPRP